VTSILHVLCTQLLLSAYEILTVVLLARYDSFLLRPRSQVSLEIIVHFKMIRV